MAPEVMFLLNFFKSSLLKGFSQMSEGIRGVFEDSLPQYVDSYSRKFKYTKTFLHRGENLDFYKLFFPTRLFYGRGDGNHIKVESVNELFSISNFISVIGPAGSGKSMLTKHIFLKSIYEKFKIPIYIELRKYGRSGENLLSYIRSHIAINSVKEDEDAFERSLIEGGYVIILDGFDELYSEQKSKIVMDIETFIDSYSLNNYLITSRPGTNIELFPRFLNTYVCRLSNEEVNAFIIQQVQIWGKDELFAKRIIDTIHGDLGSGYFDYVSNPLLLSMYILSFENNPELPKRKSKFYANVFNTLCFRHDSVSKLGWLHERKTGLSVEQIEDVLKVFCFLTYFKGKIELTKREFEETLELTKNSLKLQFDGNNLLYDLTVSLSIIIEDGEILRFPHRSLQEYFAALFIKEEDYKHKKRIYSELFKKISVRSFDYSNNFWDLCQEMDESAFYKFFILPELEKLEIEKLDDYELLVRICEVGQYVILIDSNAEGYEVVAYGSQADIVNEIIDYIHEFSEEIMAVLSELITRNLESVEEVINENLKSKMEERKDSEILLPYVHKDIDVAILLPLLTLDLRNELLREVACFKVKYLDILKYVSDKSEESDNLLDLLK